MCYVGSLDLREGFVYLLKAIRAIGQKHIGLRIAGATGDRDCAQVFARESAGLPVRVSPGESLPVYQQSELLVVPTLEDGLPFVLPEGLACESGDCYSAKRALGMRPDKAVIGGAGRRR